MNSIVSIRPGTTAGAFSIGLPTLKGRDRGKGLDWRLYELVSGLGDCRFEEFWLSDGQSRGRKQLLSTEKAAVL
jgi:hypothetical protein